MADLNKLADSFNEAFNRHDVEALAQMTTENVTLKAPTGTVTGREAGKAYNQAWFDAFPDARITVTNRIVGNNVVVEEGVFEGTHTGTFQTPAGDIPPTGRSIRGPYCGISEYEGDLTASSRLYYDQVDVLTQLGLMPAPAGVA